MTDIPNQVNRTTEIQEQLVRRPVDGYSPLWHRVAALYEAAFPLCERRDLEEWERLADEKGAFRLDAILYGDRFAGFISYWRLEKFCYVEHFAIDASQRGGGIGGRILDELRTTMPIPLVLEVELPKTLIAQRRISFYERHGFTLDTADYLQPPYRQTDKCLPLNLMTTAPETLASCRQSFINLLYRTVYGWDVPIGQVPHHTSLTI